MLETILEILDSWVNSITHFVKSNLRNFAKMLNILMPYIMLFVGQYVYSKRNTFVVGGEIFIPLIACIVICFIRSYANKIGKGTTIPIPHKRFTSVDDNEEVSIEYDRVQELLLYTADLEDWLERKGLL